MITGNISECWILRSFKLVSQVILVVFILYIMSYEKSYSNILWTVFLFCSESQIYDEWGKIFIMILIHICWKREHHHHQTFPDSCISFFFNDNFCFISEIKKLVSYQSLRTWTTYPPKTSLFSFCTWVSTWKRHHCNIFQLHCNSCINWFLRCCS